MIVYTESIHSLENVQLAVQSGALAVISDNLQALWSSHHYSPVILPVSLLLLLHHPSVPSHKEKTHFVTLLGGKYLTTTIISLTKGNSGKLQYLPEKDLKSTVELQ